jgi:hypothetical protein
MNEMRVAQEEDSKERKKMLDKVWQIQDGVLEPRRPALSFSREEHRVGNSNSPR